MKNSFEIDRNHLLTMLGGNLKPARASRRTSKGLCSISLPIPTMPRVSRTEFASTTNTCRFT